MNNQGNLNLIMNKLYLIIKMEYFMNKSLGNKVIQKNLFNIKVRQRNN